MDNAYSEASTLKLVKEHRDGKALQLQLTARGQTWLSADTKNQYTQVFEEFRSLPKQSSGYYPDFDPYDVVSSRYFSYYSYSILSDRVFLGSDFAVVPPRTGKNGKKSTTPTVDDLKGTSRSDREGSIVALPEGTYYLASTT